MFGEKASKVKIDLSDISNMEYSFKIMHEWSKSMKAAISHDVEAFSYGGDVRHGEADRRYTFACDEVIIDLLFELKWAFILAEKLKDENQA